MTRLTRYLLPTEKEAPADAEAVSHKLMVRAGLIRQLGAGLWTWMPAGLRAHRKAEQIMREEMDAIGAQEMLMPVMHPAELWQTTGRYAIDELFKLQDRRGAELVLAMTNEESITFHMARIVRSYRDLPFTTYHIQTKERDEPRPRAGVLRTREFIMKDAYSFDRDKAGLDASYDLQAGAYDRIYDRAGLEWYSVESDVGAMGGIGAHEYMAPCAAGEDDVALSDAGYAANVQIATGTPRPVEGLPAPQDAPERVETPGAKTVEQVCAALDVPAGALIKAMPVLVGEDAEPLLVVVRGDHRLDEIKLANALGKPARAATEDEVRDRFGAPPGFIGPVGAQAPVLADEALRGLAGLVAGANEPDAHLRGVEVGRDFDCDFADVRTRRGRRHLPRGRRDPDRARDRGGQHLQARHALLRAAGRQVPRRGRRRAADLDGLLRHRPGTDRGRGGGAVRRRPRHLVAALAGAVRHPSGHAGQGGRGRPPGGR